MIRADVQRDLDQLGEIYPGMVLRADIGKNYWTRDDKHIHFMVVIPDRGSLYDKKGYILSRFKGTARKLDGLTSSKVVSIHKTFVKKCIKLAKDYDMLQSFIDAEIKFKYTKANIYSRNIVFNIEDPDAQDLVIYVSYTINKEGEIVIINNQSTRYINAGALFIKMQKELAEKTENKLKIFNN